MTHKRWSLPFDEETKVSEYTGDSDHDVNTMAWLINLYGIKDMLSVSVEEMKDAHYAKAACSEWSHWFYLDGWDDSYGGSQNNLYLGEGTYQEIYDNLQSLTEHGYDVRLQWREFRELLKSIWTLLPDFYKGDTMYDIKPPSDYNPNKPFPNLPIPQDIDE